MGVWSGTGIVIANMVGAGVFLSSGFMAQEMGPGTILLAWLVGAMLALAGTRAYAAVARLVPRSGGEYRYLSDLLHPSAGYLAGWASLLLGFSAPVAIDALAVGAFATTLHAALEPRLVAVSVVLALTAVHATGLDLSRRTQNLLVVIKVVLVLGFVLVGLAFGRLAWPTWTPPSATAGFPLAPFMRSLFYIAFAFAGWNAAAYVADEFRAPKRDVPRAMLAGCLLVGLLYMLLNWVLIANLTPARAAVVFNYETSRVTLGHLVMADIVGDVGARVMSGFVIVALISSMSAMTLAGPRVYATMAADGFLPRFLVAREGGPPTGSVLLQGFLALLIVAAQDLAQVMQNLGAILTLFSALTTLALLRVHFSRPDLGRVPTGAVVCAALYALSATWMLYFGFQGRTRLLLWLAVLFITALVGYGLTRRRRSLAG